MYWQDYYNNSFYSTEHPDRVSISTVGHTGPMIEGKQYELQCNVYNVAPVHLLTVNWYKGQHLVAKTSFSDSTKTPMNRSTRFHMSLSRADDGVRYSCEAELKLSRAEASSKVASQVLGLTVHCTSLLKLLTIPQLLHNNLQQLFIKFCKYPLLELWSTCLLSSDSPQVSSVVEIFNETTKDIALNCTVMANPPPSYTWNSTNLKKALNTGHAVLYISSLGSGNYTCTASNGIGSISKLFIVQAKPRGEWETLFCPVSGLFFNIKRLEDFVFTLVKKSLSFFF